MKAVCVRYLRNKAFILLLLCVGCGSDPSPRMSQPNANLEIEPPDNNSNASGSTGSAPVETGFWKDTDDRLLLYRYSTERGDSGEYAAIMELHRSQMSAATLSFLEMVSGNTYSVESFFRFREIDESGAVLFTADELMYPDCQPLASTGNVFYVAISSGTVGEPVSLVSSNACGTVNLFAPDVIDGVVNPHDLLTSVVIIVNQ